MDTGGNGEVTAAARKAAAAAAARADEAQMRQDVTYRRLLRFAARYDRDDELDAVNALGEKLRASADTAELAELAAVAAVRARRRQTPLDEHPVAIAAVDALHAQMAGRPTRAALIATAALDAHPGTVDIVVLKWVEAYFRHATGGRRAGPPVDVAGVGVYAGTGEVVEQQDLPDAAQWALALLRAYGNDDRSGYSALLNRLNDDGPALMPALLTIIADSIRQLPRAWAWQDDPIAGAGAVGAV